MLQQTFFTFALAGKVLISWMRKVSGLTMITRGMPVVCCTQQTRPGWFMTSDHWHRAGDILLLPPLELKRAEQKVSLFFCFAYNVWRQIYIKVKRNCVVWNGVTIWQWLEKASEHPLCFDSLWQQKIFLDCSWRKASGGHGSNRRTHRHRPPVRWNPAVTNSHF